MYLFLKPERKQPRCKGPGAPQEDWVFETKTVAGCPGERGEINPPINSQTQSKHIHKTREANNFGHIFIIWVLAVMSLRVRNLEGSGNWKGIILCFFVVAFVWVFQYCRYLSFSHSITILYCCICLFVWSAVWKFSPHNPVFLWERPLFVCLNICLSSTLRVLQISVFFSSYYCGRLLPPLLWLPHTGETTVDLAILRHQHWL